MKSDSINDGKIDQRETLPFREKFFYGLGDSGFNILNAALSFYLTYFLINVGGLEAKLASIVLLVAKFFDAFACFFMGIIADKTENKRFGNRRVYMIFVSIPFGLSFILLWLTPVSGNSQALRVVYYIFSYIVFVIFFEIGYIPYNAISANMTSDYDERTSINGYRIVLANIGILVGAAVFAVLADGPDSVFAQSFGNLRTAYLVTSCIYAVVAGVIIFLSGFMVRERIDAREKRTKSLLLTLKEFILLKELRNVTIWYITSLAGFDIIMGYYMFYINDCLKFGGGTMAMVLIAIPLVAAIASAAGWVYFSEKFAKESVYIVSAIWMFVGLLISLFIPEKCLWAIIIAAAFVGAGMSAIQILPYAAVPDVVDVDEYTYGERREALFYGILQLLYKLLSGISTSVCTAIIGAFGYKESNDGSVREQPKKALWAVRIIFGIGPSVFFCAAIVPALKSRISRERIVDIKDELNNRRSNLQSSALNEISEQSIQNSDQEKQRTFN